MPALGTTPKGSPRAVFCMAFATSEYFPLSLISFPSTRISSTSNFRYGCVDKTVKLNFHFSEKVFVALEYEIREGKILE